jgi:hypothetical protein
MHAEPIDSWLIGAIAIPRSGRKSRILRVWGWASVASFEGRGDAASGISTLQMWPNLRLARAVFQRSGPPLPLAGRHDTCNNKNREQWKIDQTGKFREWMDPNAV